MYISKNVKYLRNKIGLTQRQLADKIGKTNAAVSEYEKGKATPPIEVALKLCELFDLSLDEFATKDLQKLEIINEGNTAVVKEEVVNYITEYRDLQAHLEKQNKTLERLNDLLELRLKNLEDQIRKHAPTLAKELGLLD